ncbi:ribose-5-phosphate isomerase RpiA [Gloeobacter kilaueensis]|uniref:Ribose-5-phosphate isomerase A n=1 Tax=Gloeobacter kilaueensis (strain ATCC BAA-2537 / CCAP 1431/1 / ULC 316 / JS1) TaxID=1183438 RepID=U5QS13_GLOK1|nr:ribose-5-phosphate isomerase RpiA [Gloeobacter kilaueensis]AGY60485.1 ribose-5-phosphate isomerase A [Gloeobacter kilaueensis JS1]
MSTQTQIDQLKEAAARQAVALAQDGMVLGLGTGSTAAFAVAALGERVQAGLKIVGVPTSERTAQQARSLGIPLATLEEQPRLDLTIDGADEVEVESLALVKGLGGALLREKIVAAASTRLVIVVDAGKLVDRLGSRSPLPVEVVPFGWRTTQTRLQNMGLRPTLRLGTDGQAYLSDGGHYILDCATGPIADPAGLEIALATTIGVVESGLFIGMASQVIVARPEGIQTLQAGGEHP